LEGIFGADLNGAKVGRSGMKGYAAFLQNAGLGRGGAQSVSLGWYAVYRLDTGRRKDEGRTMGQTSSVVLAGDVTGRMPVPLWIRGQGSSVCSRDATIANRDDMPGSLGRMVRPQGHLLLNV
jgi:hypothetical protein